MKETKSRAISNGDSTNPIQASVVVSVSDPTIKGLVALNPDGSKIGGGTSTDEKVKYDSLDPAAGYIVDKFTAGTGISLSEGTGADENKLQITNISPDQTVSLTNGTGISISGTYPDFTIVNTSPASIIDLTPYARLDGSNTPFTGNIGFGSGVTPTAKAHFGAGSATAGTAPLKFTSGALNISPEIGAMEFFNDGLFFGITTPRGVGIPYYPPTSAQTTATSNFGPSYLPYFATDTTRSLTGTWDNTSWIASTYTNQRLHIDLGTATIINKIYYENLHNSGSGAYGAKTFTFWGSNSASAFADTVYSHDTNWTQLNQSQSTFDIHTNSDAPDPKYITSTNNVAYRYYAIKIADGYASSSFFGLRHIELLYNATNYRRSVVLADTDAMTIGRIPYTTTGGRLLDTANLTFSPVSNVNRLTITGTGSSGDTAGLTISGSNVSSGNVPLSLTYQTNAGGTRTHSFKVRGSSNIPSLLLDNNTGNPSTVISASGSQYIGMGGVLGAVIFTDSATNLRADTYSGSTGTSQFTFTAGSLLGNPEVAHTWSVGRRSTTAAGSALTLQAGGGRSGQSNLAGGNIIVSGGISTGTGGSCVQFYTATPGLTGTADNNPTEKARICGNGYFGINTISAHSYLQVEGAVAFKTNIITTNTTLDVAHSTVIVSNGSTITLPTAVGIQGRKYNIIRSGTSDVPILTTSSQTISGDASLTLSSQWDSVVVVSDNANRVRCS